MAHNNKIFNEGEEDPMEHEGLGSEHPLNDKMQPIFILLFFVALVADSLHLLPSDYSTVLFNAFSIPILVLPAALFILVGLVLVDRSHREVLFSSREEAQKYARFVDSGVYSKVRHPMYLGGLLILLGFLLVSASFLAFGVWALFFVFMNRMATYEEKDLIKILGEEYVSYQHRVPKWFPRL
jgi:protein-S-isoprenylcysteine O-methyltransferase Ste14